MEDKGNVNTSPLRNARKRSSKKKQRRRLVIKIINVKFSPIKDLRSSNEINEGIVIDPREGRSKTIVKKNGVCGPENEVHQEKDHFHFESHYKCQINVK